MTRDEAFLAYRLAVDRAEKRVKKLRLRPDRLESDQELRALEREIEAARSALAAFCRGTSRPPRRDSLR